MDKEKMKAIAFYILCFFFVLLPSSMIYVMITHTHRCYQYTCPKEREVRIKKFINDCLEKDNHHTEFSCAKKAAFNFACDDKVVEFEDDMGDYQLIFKEKEKTEEEE